MFPEVPSSSIEAKHTNQRDLHIIVARKNRLQPQSGVESAKAPAENSDSFGFRSR